MATPTDKEVSRVTTENAAEVSKALGLGEPLILVSAPDMIWTRSVPATGKEVSRVTTEMAAEVSKALGLGEPLILVDAPDMIWVEADK